MFILYNVIFAIFAVFYLPAFLLKGKWRPGSGSYFGGVPEIVRRSITGQKVIWLHAVSVGEAALAMRLLADWRSRFPQKKFVLTVTTPAAHDVASRQKNPADFVLWYPVDFPFSVRRFLNTVRPEAVVILETEIWPNLLRELKRRSIPVFLLNARISDKAYPQYKKIKFFLKKILPLFVKIGAQDETMKERFLELGANPSGVEVTGNLKFDWLPAAPEASSVDFCAQLKRNGRPIVLAVSTHEGEEAILFSWWQARPPASPPAQLVIAPRHPHRLEAVYALARSRGLTVKKVFSGINNRYDDKDLGAVYLVDKLGVLPAFYQAADLVFVGGSLFPIGGHNVVEPAYFGKPVIVGPHVQNFKEIVRVFEDSGALLKARDTQTFLTALEALLADKARMKTMGERAKKITDHEKGALFNCAKILTQYWESK